MPDIIFSTVINSTVDAKSFIICTLTSIILGLVIACAAMYKSRTSPGFITALALLPVVVEIVIMLVNGNIGAGVAVAGAFSLVRFRSAAGSAKEITGIFLSMAVGIATGMGYIGIAVIFTLTVTVLEIIFAYVHFGESKKEMKNLKVTIPESLDYTGVFEDIFTKYTSEHELLKVKTSSMGSLFTLSYSFVPLKGISEKDFLDEIRTRNGNLDIICSKIPESREEL